MSATAVRLGSALAGSYRLERELGSGGMATVYLAEDVKHHRKVAVKVLHPELSAVIGAERFLKEIELTASLQHPHVLPLFDSGSADGLLYYVMPYVDGETLRARLSREHQLPLPDAIRIAAEVADALDYAHRRAVVHRDIKPENILLHDGRPLVADFGIALAGEDVGVPAAARAVGTAAASRRRPVLPVLAAAATGALGAERRRVIGTPVPVFRGVRTEETHGFGQFDVADDGTLVYAPGRNASIGLIGLVDTPGRIDTLAFPAGEYNNMFVDPSGWRAVAQRRTGAGIGFEVVLLDLEREVPQVIPTSDYPMAWWPRGDSLIMSSAPRPRTGRDSVWSFALAGGSRRRLPVWMGFVRAVSPDERWMAWQDSSVVRLIPPNDTSAAVPLGPGGSWMSFSPDGRWFAFPAGGSGGGIVLARVPFDGRRRQVSSDNGEQPRWTRRGDRLVYRRGSQFMTVDVNPSTGAVGKPRPLLAGPFPRVTGWSYDVVPDGRLLVIVGPDERTARHLNVVTNFGAELSRLTRPAR